MKTAVEIVASNDEYSSNQKYWVARLVGRNRKYGFEREFLGHDVTTDIEGVYQVRDINRKGIQENTFYLVWTDEGELVRNAITEEMALELVAENDKKTVKWPERGRCAIATRYREQLERAVNKPQDETLRTSSLPQRFAYGELPNLATRAEVQAAREQEIARLEKPDTPNWSLVEN